MCFAGDIPFSIQSLTKQFTAAAILMLHEEGKLSLEDDITKYLELPARFNGMKIKHLISTPLEYRICRFIQKYRELNLKDMIGQSKDIEFREPGTEFAYSNPTYSNFS